MMRRISVFIISWCFIILCVQAQPEGWLLQNYSGDTVACNKWVNEQLTGMTLKQKIGQLFIHTVAPIVHQKNKEQLRNVIEEYGIGGLLFSGGELKKQVELTNFAQQITEIPLMITFDGEWGLAMRLKKMPAFPKNRVLGCIQNDTLIYQYGKEVARQLREIGVHVNFAPVADIDNNPDNPVINVRSFGSNPDEVARKVVAYAHGLEDGGIMAVCKHFPGHGDTNVDSHHFTPVLRFDRARLDSIELYPFKRAIEEGVDGIMVGHLRVPSINNEPASISRPIITGILRRDLGFSGLVFTDALEMKGISQNSDICTKALLAGNDMLLVPRNLKREMGNVLNAVKKGLLTEQLITEKCRKVLQYKYILGLNKPQLIADEAEERIVTGETTALITKLEKAAVTVVKDSIEMLPLDLSLSGNVLLSISPSLAESYPFYKSLKESTSLSWVHANKDSLQQIRERLRAAQQIVVAVYQDKIDTFIPLIQEVAKDKPLAVVCFTSQQIAEKMSDALSQVSTVILAHAKNDEVQRHVAYGMTGKAILDGRLSVAIEGVADAGSGVTIDPDRPRSFFPEDFGMDSLILNRIDSIAMEGIAEGAYPGCHVLVLKEGYPVYNKCFGTYTYEKKQRVRENSMYDLASLTKVTATLLGIMKLYDEGKLGLTDKIGQYLSILKGTDKEQITIQELLYHESGLPAYLPFYKETIDMETCKGGLFSRVKDKNHQFQIGADLFACTDFSYKKEWVSDTLSERYGLQIADRLFVRDDFPDEMLKQIAEVSRKDRDYRYSCLNFVLLKEIVESVAGVPMDEYLDSVFYRPMGLIHTSYNPLTRFDREDIVPTVEEDFLRGPLQGYVHDEIAAFMGGISGNAGLFSNARDVAVIFQMLLDRGVCGDRRYLSRATCDLFLGMKSKNSWRGLGFDKPNIENIEISSCAPEAPVSVFGHTGFTGTCAWGDPDNDIVYVFLSNRIYPQVYGRDKLMRLDIRTRIQQVIYQSLGE